MQCGTSDHRNFAVSYHAGHVVETLGMSWNEQQKCVPVQLFLYVKNPRFFTVACTGAHEYGAVADAFPQFHSFYKSGCRWLDIESVRIGFCLGGNDRETACGFVHDGPDFFAFFQ